MKLNALGNAWPIPLSAVSGGAGDLVTTMMRDREIGIGAEVGLMDLKDM